MQFKCSYLRTSSSMARKYTLYTNENLLFWQLVSTKKFHIIDTWPDSLHLNYRVTPIHRKVTRHILQFMICIDKGRAKKKEKKKKQQSVKKQWHNVSQELCFWSPLVWFVLFSLKIMEWKLQRESYMRE